MSAKRCSLFCTLCVALSCVFQANKLAGDAQKRKFLKVENIKQT